MRRGFAFLALTLAGVIFACTDLKSAEEAPAADGGSDAGTAADATPDVDLGAPPPDFSCDEPWATKPKTSTKEMTG